jgi:Family of unknown function (DUF6459)
MSLRSIAEASMVDTAAKVGAGGPGAERAWPRIAVRAIPELSPPIIDSRTAVLQDPSPFIQGALAMDFSVGCDVVQDPEDPEDPEYFGPQRTFTRNLPEPQAWVRHMAQALVEVMSGARPAPQVIRWTSPEVYSVVARRNAVSGRRAIVARRALVLRSGSANRSTAWSRHAPWSWTTAGSGRWPCGSPASTAGGWSASSKSADSVG